MLQAQLFIDLDEMRGDLSMHEYILKFLSERGISGATSFRGYAGFGANHKIKYPGEIFSFDEPPAMIVFIDEDEKVRQVARELKAIFPSKLLVVTRVEKIEP